MNRTTEGAQRGVTRLPVPVAADKLCESDNPIDQRKGRDLRRVLELSQGVWKGLVTPLEVLPGAEGAIALLANIKCAGLYYNGYEPIAHDLWTCAAILGSRYPLSMPLLQFVGRIPYAAHVINADFPPPRNERELPEELARYLRAIREGQQNGATCFCTHESWDPCSLEFDIARALYQASRILSGRAFHAEAGALNRSARDWFLMLAEKPDGLPLGPCLPFPGGESVGALKDLSPSADSNTKEAEGAIQWVSS